MKEEGGGVFEIRIASEGNCRGCSTYEAGFPKWHAPTPRPIVFGMVGS